MSKPLLYNLTFIVSNHHEHPWFLHNFSTNTEVKGIQSAWKIRSQTFYYSRTKFHVHTDVQLLSNISNPFFCTHLATIGTTKGIIWQQELILKASIRKKHTYTQWACEFTSSTAINYRSSFNYGKFKSYSTTVLFFLKLSDGYLF